jgi:hypothetical protein
MTIEILLDGNLVFSPATTAPPAVLTLRRHPRGGYFGYGLLEFRDRSGKGPVFADISTPFGNLLLYGQTRGALLPGNGEAFHPVGIRCQMDTGDDRLPPQKMLIDVQVMDAANTQLMAMQLLVYGQPVNEPALMDLASAGVPQHVAEAGRASNVIHAIETLVPTPALKTLVVSYALRPKPGSPAPARALFTQVPANSLSQYSAPAGPTVDDIYGGGTPAGTTSETYMLAAKAFDPGGGPVPPPQEIPFISWIADTPSRGELMIVGIDQDPKGSDEPSESITLENVSRRIINIGGCFIKDEQVSPLLQGLAQAVGQTLTYSAETTHVLPGRLLLPGERLDVFPHFTMNNDHDCFRLFNARGRRLQTWGYLFPGGPPQRTIFLTSVRLPGTSDEVEVKLPALEDGDTVILSPDPASRAYSGIVGPPAFGPEGLPSVLATLDPKFQAVPLPNEAVFALLYQWVGPGTAGGIRLLGGTEKKIVVNRTSTADHGIGVNPFQSTLSFTRNDTPIGDTWGRDAFAGTFPNNFFDIEVRVMRR